MTTYVGGAQVKSGYYLDTSKLSVANVQKDGGTLPGAATEGYFHAPLPVVLTIAPLMGAAFLVFLPFIGFYLVGQAAVRPVARVFRRSATEMAATVRPGWQPGEAHLTGRRAEGEHKGEEARKEAAEGELSELEREIAAKRRGEK